MIKNQNKPRLTERKETHRFSVPIVRVLGLSIHNQYTNFGIKKTTKTNNNNTKNEIYNESNVGLSPKS